MRKTFVVVKTTFSALHAWPECPYEDVAFLRTPHRHIFYVTMKIQTMKDRELEFIRLKKELDFYIRDNWEGNNLGKLSCEKIAENLMNNFNANFVGVFEDDENGAEIWND